MPQTLPPDLLEDIFVAAATAHAGAAPATLASAVADAVAAATVRDGGGNYGGGGGLGHTAPVDTAGNGGFDASRPLAFLLECSLTSRDLHASCWTAARPRARLLRHLAAAAAASAPAPWKPSQSTYAPSPAAHSILVWADVFADFPAVLDLLVRPGPGAGSAAAHTLLPALSPASQPDAPAVLLRLLPLGRDVATDCLEVLLRAGFSPRCLDDDLLADAVAGDAPVELVDCVLSAKSRAQGPQSSTTASTRSRDPGPGSATSASTEKACLSACRAGNFAVLQSLLPRVLPPGQHIPDSNAAATTAARRLLADAVVSGNIAVLRIVLDGIVRCPSAAGAVSDPAALYPFLAQAAEHGATEIMEHLIVRWSVPVDPPPPPRPALGMAYPNYSCMAVSLATFYAGRLPMAVNSSWSAALAISNALTHPMASISQWATNPAGIAHLKRYFHRFQLHVSSMAVAATLRPTPDTTIDLQKRVEHRALQALCRRDSEAEPMEAPGAKLAALGGNEFARVLQETEGTLSGDHAATLSLLFAAGVDPNLPNSKNPLVHICHAPADDYFEDVDRIAAFLGVGGVWPPTGVREDEGQIDASRLFFTRPAWQRPDPDSGYRGGRRGGSPLYYVLTLSRQPAIAQLLLFAGARATPDALAPPPWALQSSLEFDGDGRRCVLHRAVDERNLPMVKLITSDPGGLLAACTAHVARHPEGDDGETPLHAAARADDDEFGEVPGIVAALLAAMPQLAGARNAAGETALDVAVLPEVARALSEFVGERVG
ncbi:hypothetical protein HK405_008300, partial [Cladochytrium tenue]